MAGKYGSDSNMACYFALNTIEGSKSGADPGEGGAPRQAAVNKLPVENNKLPAVPPENKSEQHK
jgi:hypothetical protein